MELNFNIFISHDSRDEAVAIGLKNFLESIFLNSSVYVSGRDLQGGQTWIENIKISLKTSQVIVSLITKESINNYWMYFETGAGFIDDKSIPLLADNLKFTELMPPLSLLQARTLTKTGIESLLSDISIKLNLRKPKMLTGLDTLLEESEKFFSLRKSESIVNSSIKKENITIIESQKNPIISDSEDDPDLLSNYHKAVARTEQLLRKKISSYKSKLTIPIEEELDGLDMSKLQEVARAYNIPVPSLVVMNLLVATLKFPTKDAKQWEKMNTLKTISDANLELDKYEKTI